MLPGALFDSVAENLLQNALAKRQREPGLSISVAFDGVALSVTDDGSAIAPALADGLLREPMLSNDGLGIGLYHAARQADTLGYRLALAESRAGAGHFLPWRRLFELVQAINPGVALAFQVNLHRCREIKGINQALEGGAVHMNHARRAFAGDPAGQVDRVAPQVVDELLLADHTGNRRAGADADADVQVQVVYP